MFPDWTGQTVFCIASGPSLTVEDCEAVRGLPAIVTNTTFRRCPWADAVFGADVSWWTWHLREVMERCAGLRFCDFDRRGTTDANRHPRYRSFGNSGACAIALAAACGATRIVLLGFDCQLTDGKSHHHGNHPAVLRNCDTLSKWPVQFEQCAAFVERMGVTVINATRSTALTCFPVAPLDSELDAWLTIS